MRPNFYFKRMLAKFLSRKLQFKTTLCWLRTDQRDYTYKKLYTDKNRVLYTDFYVYIQDYI